MNATTRTILLVDDNQNAVLLLKDYLTSQGYRTVSAENGRVALDILEQTKPDLILLDVMMPQMDGYQFIGRVRRSSKIPIIMLTAKRKESDVVLGFELGADDYIVKPYRMRELLMRIRAVMRRSVPDDSAENRITIGTLVIDLDSFQVTVAGRRADLTPVEMHLLECLARANGLPVHRAALSTHLIERGFSGSESTIKIHIRNLRQKIEDDPTSPTLVETVFGIGYRLAGDSP